LDHTTPRKAGGADIAHNLVWLCHSCHSRKTARHNGGFGNKFKGLTGCDANGLPLDPNHHWRKT
jgi:5-methylcytosine-specific restriction endonuclease McrA